MKKIIKTDEEWKNLLTENEYYITRKKGTEPPFSGKNFEIINTSFKDYRKSTQQR